MKVALLLCVVVATATAAPRTRSTRLDPKLSDHVRAAETAWTAAERERDKQKQPALWEAAATAFDAIDGDAVEPAVKRDAAFAAVLAWTNAVDTPAPADAAYGAPAPKPLPAREQKLVGAIARFVKLAPATDAELPGVMLLEARTLLRFDHLDDALPKLKLVFDTFHDRDVAVFAANYMLDSLDRLQRYDELVAFAKQLAGDAKLMQANHDLAELVGKIVDISARKELERQSQIARTTREYAAYVAVGNGYLELYNKHPDARDNDEILYNAGVSFEEGRAMTAAIRAFELLQKYYPNSRITARAIARVGKLYGDIAMYAEAADKLELYAKKYTGEKDAFDAMSDAVLYRKALGDRDKAIADIEFITRVFGAKKPHETAEAQWSLAALFESEPDREMLLLRNYLKNFASHSEPERVTIAHARIGQRLWKQSCPVAGVDGLCVTIDERAARSCGKGASRAVFAVTRDQQKRAEAMIEFTAAVADYERQRRHDDPSARYFYAQAKLALADAELEASLLPFPRGLSFDPNNAAVRTASTKRFSTWVELRQKIANQASRGYEQVLTIKDVATSITAAERFGVLSQSFSSALVTAGIPLDVRTGPRAADKVKAYCDAMTEVAEPLEARAAEAFSMCLVKSTELSWFGDSSAFCERSLGALKPAEFPRSRELRAPAELAAPIVALEPAMEPAPAVP